MMKNTEKQEQLVKGGQIENSPKVLTTSIKNLMDWEEFRGKMTFIFEIFGILESAVSTGISNNSKTFILKDDTGSIRCTFWEMTYRCIGSMDRMKRSFNCVTVRPSTLAELHSAKISIACAQLVMQAYIATFRED
ncbi:spermatogenesis-associated protein 22-like [Actinia tenebrosa]|uniref:Spermatogenesis-associated protein 22-like n=1 Tax=Actinia tenebrosa TaxID=6105 RepID=A0A6P8HZY0_ACTTE|nr:spermatogenesis-associated protein 22-like [Actinia tenebrosa]